MTIGEAFTLAQQLHQAGRLTDAEALYRQILTVVPNQADALHYLGVIAHQTGRGELAIKLIERSISADPRNAAAHANLAVAYREVGRLREAIASCRQAIELAPQHVNAHHNLGDALRDSGRLEEAIAVYRHTLELDSQAPVTQSNLGIALAKQGKLGPALESVRHALQLAPDFAEAYNNLGNIFRELGELDQALSALKRCIQINPTFAPGYANLGNVLKDAGFVDEALEVYRQAIALAPNLAYLQSNLIYSLLFLSSLDEAAIAFEQREWNQKFSFPVGALPATEVAGRDPNRKLRIGYVSAHFRHHVIGRNLMPLFRYHQHEEYEIFCYSAVASPDSLTEELRLLVDHWRAIGGCSVDEIATIIREDAIDILVDLTQHLSDNFLEVFARRPAPVQVSFAGFPESTGLDAIRYRISDRYMESAVSPIAKRGREQLHLIDSFWCYDPCGAKVSVSLPPVLTTGHITFGSLNNFCKINAEVLKLWARILVEASDSRLILLAPEGSHRERTTKFLALQGAKAERVEFVRPTAREEYLELYHRIDIALDPFPYGGHTTSLDALWMGLPVVSLAGKTPISRAGVSQLTNLGVAEWIADSQDEYIRIASQLASDRQGLADWRKTLRKRMERSILTDGARFARQIEDAFRAIWADWCWRGKG